MKKFIPIALIVLLATIAGCAQFTGPIPAAVVVDQTSHEIQNTYEGGYAAIVCGSTATCKYTVDVKNADGSISVGSPEVVPAGQTHEFATKRGMVYVQSIGTWTTYASSSKEALDARLKEVKGK